MKIIEQQLEHGDLLITLEDGGPTKKSFCIQKKGGDMVIGNFYEDEINIDSLIDCLAKVKGFLAGGEEYESK